MRRHFARFFSLYFGIVGGIIIVTLFVTANSARPNDDTNIKPISVATQLSNVAGTTGSTLPALTQQQIAKNKTYSKEKLVPVTATPISDILALEPNKAGTFPAAVVNTNTNIAALAVTDAAGQHILVTRYLESQAQGLFNTLTKLGAKVTIDTNPTTSSTVAVATQADRSGYYGNYPSTSNTSPAANTSTQNNGMGWLSALGMILFLGYAAFFLIRALRRARGLNVRGPINHQDEDITSTVRFTDVAGCDEAIDEMGEMVQFLKNPDRFAVTGAKAPRGALLVGPPGTGKTLLARAVAGEAGVPFYSVAGSDFTEMYVGVGAKRVRELFAKARKHKEGAIIFIDEIDAVGRSRSATGSAGNQETENTLNALLVEMDGFSKSNIIVIAATNRDDMLDAALTRPGRLDRKIQVPLPDRLGRERILKVHAADKPFEPNVNFNLIARRTPGMSGAELAQVVNEAATSAARDGRTTITDLDFDHAVATVAMGKARTSAVVTEHDRTVTAWHEAGHTVSAMVLPDADPPVSVSIIPRGPAGGVTWMAQGDDLFLTRRRAFARLVVAMSGRAAEELLLDGEFTSGPHGDLHAATNTALAMVTQYGMTDTGLMIRSEGLLSTGSKMTDETVEAVERLLAEALETARATLNGHRKLFDKIVAGLLDNDTLTQADLEAIQAGSRKNPPRLPDAPVNYRKEKAGASVTEPTVVREVVRVRNRSLVGSIISVAGVVASSLIRKRRKKAR